MKIETIPIHLLDAHPDNPRLELRQEVIETIRAQLAQYGYDEAHAILVRPIGERYQILSGHHRVEAAQAEGIPSIPAWVREYSDEEAYMQLMLWNTQEDLSPIEKGKHAKLAVTKWSKNGKSIKDYAQQVYGEKSGRAKQQMIQDQIAAWEVYEKKQDILFSDKYFSQLVVIHGAEEEEWPALCEQLVDEDWTVEETERAVKPVKRRKATKTTPAKTTHPVAITLEDWKKLDPAKQEGILDWQGRRYNSRFNEQKTDDIEWAKSSWNPVTGCLHNCPYCYAREIAEHIYPEGFAPTLHMDRLSAPALTPVPPQAERDVSYRNVFTCSMADLFGRWVPDEWIKAVLEVVRHNPQWNFLFLTKFPIRMSKFTYPSNAWLGTSVDLQRRVKNAERAMREVRSASIKWLSLEPLIEPLQFEDLSQFQWVVIGGASPTKTSIGSTPEWKPPRDWVWTLTQQAQRAGCRVYHKTNLHERLRDFPGDPHYQADPAEAPPIFHYLKGSKNDSTELPIFQP